MPVHSRYLDIAANIRSRIEEGEWGPGARLPRLDDLAKEYSANRDTVGRAVGVLASEGYVWAVQGRGITVRHGTIRPRRPRGNLVKRNAAAAEPGYSFPSASAQEMWKHHITPITSHEPLTDSRIARMLRVSAGSPVIRRFSVTGPEAEPRYQINISWIHPRGVADAPEVAHATSPGDWIHLLEMAGHWPLSWMEVHRARLPTKEEAGLLEIPTNLPVLEIVRVGSSGRDGEPIEVTVEIVAGDRVEAFQVLHRDDSAQMPWPDATSPHDQQVTGESSHDLER